MNNLSSYLKKFKLILTSNADVKEVIVSIILEVTKGKIEPKDIDIKNKIVYIKCRPSIKNEIFIKKEQILKQLKEKIENLVIKDVR